MVGIGNGAKAQVEAQIASLGQNVILVFSGSTTASGIRTGWGGAGTLKIEDAEAIRREVPGVTAVSEEVVVHYAGRGRKSELVHPGLWASRQIISTFANGHWPTVHHLPRRMCVVQTKSVLLAEPPRRRFIGNENPIGQILRIKNVPFTIDRSVNAQGIERTGRSIRTTS